MVTLSESFRMAYAEFGGILGWKAQSAAITLSLVRVRPSSLLVSMFHVANDLPSNQHT